MIRIAAMLLLIALAACSPSRAIAVAATDVADRAAEIHRLANEIGSIATEPEVCAMAADIAVQATAINHAAGSIHNALPGVVDSVPFWAVLIKYGLVLGVVLAVVVLLWQTGIGIALRAFFGLIPKTVRTEAELAAATIDPAHKESAREWVSARRIADPLFDKAYRQQQKGTVDDDRR